MYNTASVILTEGCNLNCSFCFEGHSKDNTKRMSDDTFDKVLDKIIKENLTIIHLFGGEPLFNFTFHMQKRLLEIKDKITLFVTTNGILLDEELCRYFSYFPSKKISISCHTPLSIKAAEIATNFLAPHELCLMVVGDHLTFGKQFQKIEPIIAQNKAHFGVQFVVPDFNYSPEYTLPLYDLLYPYRKNLDTYDLFTGKKGVYDGSDVATEIIFTYDGKISLSKSTNLTANDITFSLDTPLKEILGSKFNYGEYPIQYLPWQCATCPIKDFAQASCPAVWRKINDFTLCRRSLFMYSLVKEDKEILKSEILAEQPVAHNYSEFSHNITSVMLNVTDQCNFRCRMCFCDWADHYMSQETANKAIDLALKRKNPKVDKLNINFFGGEPMLNYSLIQYLIEKWEDKCTFSMTTNGSLLTLENMDYLKEHKVGILFSIDGAKETQDYNRPFRSSKASTFDVLLKKIPEILIRWPEVTFRSTLIPETVHLLYENYCFAKRQGFKSYFCTTDAYSDWHGYENELKKQIGYITLDIIRDIYEGRETVIPKFFSDGIFDFLRIKDRDSIHINEATPFRCGLGIYGIGVGATGIISACQEHSTIQENKGDIFIIGDVDNGIDEARHMALIQKYEKERIWWRNNECQECLLHDVCISHSCPSRQGFMFGSFDKLAYADCLWTQCNYLAGNLAITFFQKNYSPNFEMYLKHLLSLKGMELRKEMEYNV